MRKFLFLFVLSLKLLGQELPLAPLMPLIPGDPLELNLVLREKLYETDQASKNVAIFQTYHFPWIPILLILIGMTVAPIALYLWRETMRKVRKEEIPTFKEIFLRLKELNPKDYSPRELSFEVAKLFKMGFENGPAMTYQELSHHLQRGRRYSEDQIASFQEQFKKLEQLQYQPIDPSLEEVSGALNRTEEILYHLLTLRKKVSE